MFRRLVFYPFPFIINFKKDISITICVTSTLKITTKVMLVAVLIEHLNCFLRKGKFLNPKAPANLFMASLKRSHFVDVSFDSLDFLITCELFAVVHLQLSVNPSTLRRRNLKTEASV